MKPFSQNSNKSCMFFLLHLVVPLTSIDMESLHTYTFSIASKWKLTDKIIDIIAIEWRFFFTSNFFIHFFVEIHWRWLLTTILLRWQKIDGFMSFEAIYLYFTGHVNCCIYAFDFILIEDCILFIAVQSHFMNVSLWQTSLLWVWIGLKKEEEEVRSNSF